MKHQRQIIDTFVNSVYVFDDRVVLNFNFTDDAKTVTREEVLGSTAVDNAPPKQEPLTKLGVRKTVFGKRHGNCLSGLVTSTRLGRGSIKSHVRTVKVLGMGLFAFQERVHLWKGVTH